jgi:hypothetical protein
MRPLSPWLASYAALEAWAHLHCSVVDDDTLVQRPDGSVRAEVVDIFTAFEGLEAMAREAHRRSLELLAQAEAMRP